MGLHLAAIVSGAATLVGVAAVAAARASAAGWRSLPALALSYASATGFVVALAAHPLAASRGSAALLAKREDGSLPLWSLVAFAPFHAGLRTKLAFQRARGTESNWDEVEPLGGMGGGRENGSRANGGGGGGGRGAAARDLRQRGRRQQKVEAAADDDDDDEKDENSLSALPYYLGGWPHEADALPPGVSAVLDVTAELPRVAASESYKNVRVWDTHGPAPTQIEAAVRWIAERRRQGKKVLVHCAHGHGRSVTVLAAALLAEREEEETKAESCSAAAAAAAPGDSSVVDSVIAHIQKFRPRAKLNSRQREALEGWLELRRKGAE